MKERNLVLNTYNKLKEIGFNLNLSNKDLDFEIPLYDKYYYNESKIGTPITSSIPSKILQKAEVGIKVEIFDANESANIISSEKTLNKMKDYAGDFFNISSINVNEKGVFFKLNQKKYRTELINEESSLFLEPINEALEKENIPFRWYELQAYDSKDVWDIDGWIIPILFIPVGILKENQDLFPNHQEYYLPSNTPETDKTFDFSKSETTSLTRNEKSELSNNSKKNNTNKFCFVDTNYERGDMYLQGTENPEEINEELFKFEETSLKAIFLNVKSALGRKKDFLLGTSHPIVSSKVKAIIEKEALNNVQFLKTNLDDYFLLHIIGTVKAFDWKNSIYTKHPPFDFLKHLKDIPDKVEKLVLNEENIDFDIFRMYEESITLFISSRLKDIFEENEVTGLTYKSLDEYKKGVV